MKLRAKQITTYSAILAVGLVVMFGLLYILIGCRRDWAVISGISIDVLGAILLASPDLGYFKTITYSGELRDIIDSFYRNAKTFTISEDEEWYDTFEREMEDVLFTENIPDDAIFKVETVKNSNLLFYYEDPDGDGTPINLNNVEGPLRSKIEREELAVRRTGAFLFVSGYLIQIFGLVIISSPIPSIAC